MEGLIEVDIINPRGRKITLRCHPSDTISDLYKKYLENGGDKYIKHPKFIYVGEVILDRTLTVYDLGIEDGDRITVNGIEKGGEIGMAAKFTDPEKDGPVEINTVKDGPDYLIACDGINLFGNCHNIGCVANNKEVAHQFGFGTYDVIADRGTKRNPICPKCKVSFIPITAGFMNCYYEFIGQKIENNKIQNVNYKNETHGRGHIHYLKIENNVLPWKSLRITAKKL